MVTQPLVWTFACALALEPFWSSQFPVAPQLTVGRAAIVLVAALAVREALRTDRLRTPPALLIVFLAGVAGLWSWVIVSSETWGCFCTGAAYGFSEMAAVAVLAALVPFLVTGCAPALLVGAAVGGLVSALLAVAGIHDVHTGVQAVDTYGSRLWGANGNPNFLALAVALCLPILLGFRAGRPRMRAAVEYAALGLGLVVIALTFSRGGMLAAGIGVVVVLLLRAPDRRRRLMVVAGVGLAALAGVLLYPAFQRARLNSDFPQADKQVAVDRSGWDTNEIGLVPVGGSRLSDVPPGSLKVTTSSSGQGVSHGLGRVQGGGIVRLTFRARSDLTGLAFAYGLADARSADRPTIRTAFLSPVWRRYSVAWHPPRTAGRAAGFFWQLGGATSFQIADVRSRLVPARAGGLSSISTHLLGAVPGQSPDKLAESRYVKSRLSDFREAVHAFASEPIRGIGFDTFPHYAVRHADYGAQATHNEYIRIPAELGVVGALLFALVVGAIVAALAALGRPRADWHVAAVGTLAGGAVGLLFVNGLEASTVALPLAVAAGAICGAARPAAVPTGDPGST